MKNISVGTTYIMENYLSKNNLFLFSREVLFKMSNCTDYNTILTAKNTLQDLKDNVYIIIILKTNLTKKHLHYLKTKHQVLSYRN